MSCRRVAGLTALLNYRLPAPSSTGNTSRWYRSTRPASANAWPSSALRHAVGSACAAAVHQDRTTVAILESGHLVHRAQDGCRPPRIVDRQGCGYDVSMQTVVPGELRHRRPHRRELFIGPAPQRSSHTSPRMSSVRLPMRSRPPVLPRRKERARAHGDSSADGSATSSGGYSRARPWRPAAAQRHLLVGVRLLRARRGAGASIWSGP
jgi:hypothetical protein